MNQLSIITQAVRTMSSPELLELVNQARADFGESPVRHNDFVARCKDELDDSDYETFVIAPPERGGRQVEAVRMTPDQCKLVAMRESKGVRRRVLARLNALEAKSATPAPAELSRMEILQLAMESEKGRLLAIEERDRAIKTKAQIGSKREATAMATAASAKRETTKLRALMGEAAGSASILAVQGKLKNRAFDWRLLKSYCKTCELEMGNSWNPGIQRDVKTYPAEAWRVVYDIDLAKLFGEVVA